MINRSIRTLPFPPASTITQELVLRIQAIPDDEIEYSDEEVAWMSRALDNLRHWIKEIKRSGGDARPIYARFTQIQEQLEAARKTRE